MRVLIVIFWVLAGTAERASLQPSQNVWALQNVSVVGESWVTQGSVPLQQHPAKEEQGEESEPRTPVSVTDTNGLHGERMLEEGQTEEDWRLITDKGGSHVENKDQQDGADEETPGELGEREEDKAGDAEGGQETFNDPEKYANESKVPALVQSENLDQSVLPTTVHQTVSQHTTPSPPQYGPPVISLASTTARSPPEILQLTTGTGEKPTPLSGLQASHPSPVTNATTLLTNGGSENMTRTESGSAKSSSKVKGHASVTAMAAKAGPTVTSMPSSVRTKSQSRVTEAKIKHQHTAKKTTNKLMKKRKEVNKLKQEKDGMTTTTAPYFPYFKDDYCPPDCACYGRVVQCSDKELDKIPYGIPYNSRYILLMNNQIDAVSMGLLSEYLSLEFLVLNHNRLRDSSIEGAFGGIQALKRLYLEQNLLQSIPTDLPASLEELRLDGNGVTVMTEAAWARCPGLLILSLSNNSLGNGSSPLPGGVLSPLGSLRVLSLSHNWLTSVPLHLPLSLQELYLRGNRIQRFQGGVFQGEAELQVLDLSVNRLTNKGLGKNAFVNATHLESLNLEGNFLKQIPPHLPRSLKTLNLEGNSISIISKMALLSMPRLEHLGLAHNKLVRISPGTFRTLPLLHHLDLDHNALKHVPRHLPHWLVSVTLTHNKIRKVPRDAFCSIGRADAPRSRLVRVQLENNLVDMGHLDSEAFSCLRGPQVVHFH
ncbi:podocan [Brachyhypopomus gauderio]|uniref:podocan n=1 Tax=Brachyhypopomus gauderio TaxID=698409 RepID=UPI00404260F2